MTYKQKILFLLAGLVILSTSSLIVFGDNGLNDFLRLNAHRKQLTGENEAIVLENARLYRQIERLKGDPNFIETIARREIGMIGKREIIVKPLNPLPRKEETETVEGVVPNTR